MQADAFVELLDQLGLGRVFIFGGSAGAMSAMQIAIRHPDRCRALALAVPAAYAPRPETDAAAPASAFTELLVRTILGSDFLFWAAMKLSPDVMTRTLLATEPSLVHAASPEEQERIGLVLRHILPVSVRAQGLLFDMKTATDPEPMEIDRIRCPVLTVSVRDDLFGTAAPAEYIAAKVADGRSVIYPTGGHVWVGHQQELWSEINSFFATVGDRSSETASQ
jgi:pimeloyl-ACP methyl ester carboxylesterase